MPRLLLPTINWECDAVPKPDKAVYLEIPTDSLDSLIMLQSCHSSIVIDDPGAAGSYSIVKAPLPDSELYRKGDGYNTEEYTAMFMVYAGSIWYVLEPSNVTIIPKLLKQDITDKVRSLTL